MLLQAQATEGSNHDITTDNILKILILETCADTLIGNSMTHSISDGQKKQVTTGN